MIYINLKDALKYLIFSFSLTVLMSCSDNSIESEPCPITIDQVSIIDSIKLESINYFLVYRVAGWSNKTEILELYNTKPVFDHCARSNIKPIYGDSLEVSQTISHVFLKKYNKKLEIIYISGEPTKTHNANLKLEIK